MATISGVITAMVTPFAEDGALDLDAARRLARHLVENGSHGVVVAGTTGESPTVSDAEKLSLLKAVKEEVGDRATIICGTGSNDTRHSVELTQDACRLGADAVLIVTPYYNKPNRAGLRAHFEAVADAAGDTPVVLYNVPSRCVINLAPDFLAELAAEIQNVVAVKQANDDDLGPIDGLQVYAGNDAVLARTLDFGGAGGILVSSHIVGDEMRRMLDEPDRRAEIDASLRDVYDAMFVTASPAPVKAALNLLGRDVGGLRLPLVECDERELAVVRSVLETHGLLEPARA